MQALHKIASPPKILSDFGLGPDFCGFREQAWDIRYSFDLANAFWVHGLNEWMNECMNKNGCTTCVIFPVCFGLSEPIFRFIGGSNCVRKAQFERRILILSRRINSLDSPFPHHSRFSLKVSAHRNYGKSTKGKPQKGKPQKGKSQEEEPKEEGSSQEASSPPKLQ